MSKFTVDQICCLVVANLLFVNHPTISAITVDHLLVQTLPWSITAQLGTKPIGASDQAVFEDVVSDKVAKLKQFLDRGGSPNHYLHTAVNSGAINSVNMMIDRGANINLPGDEGVTPLMTSVRATYRNGLEITKLLIKRGANINARAGKGSTALMYASSGVADHYEDEYVQVVRLLIKHGAKVNVKNRMGSTPLSIAKSGNYQKIAAVLKQAGAKS